jgi:tRNA threonylcarbamoyl adenosine modification protein YjeE
VSEQVLAMLCPGETDTIAFGERIGAGITTGDLLSLTGPLGAGKTVLVRGIAAGAGVDRALVRSPTFVLHHVYRGGGATLHHVDLYRLGAGADITFLDFEALLETGAVVVEWAEHADLDRFTPMRITVEVTSGENRVITLSGDAVPARVRAAWAAEADHA